MLRSSALLAVVLTAWSTTAAPHQASSSCCFSLTAASGTSMAPVKQGTNGNLWVNSDLREAFFCLNQENGRLQDGEGNNCFLQSVTKQFQCFAGVPSFNSFSFATNSDGSKQLTYDGRNSFVACTSLGSSSEDGSLDLYSSEYEGEYCFDIKLLQRDGTEACNVPATYGPPAFVKSIRPDKTDDQTAESITPIERPCRMTDRSPAIWPNRIGVGSFGDMFYLNPDGNGTITEMEGTLFEFTMQPRDFLHHTNGAPRLCAVQFRFPYCSDLPENYPCFQWSGLEQQRLSNSGMRFWHVYDTHKDVYWEPVDLVQLTPGEQVYGGTFDCMVDNDRRTNRNVSFIATGVHGWRLEFAQGGVGGQADTPDAVGAYIVGCGSDIEEGPPSRPTPTLEAE